MPLSNENVAGRLWRAVDEGSGRSCPSPQKLDLVNSRVNPIPPTDPSVGSQTRLLRSGGRCSGHVHSSSNGSLRMRARSS